MLKETNAHANYSCYLSLVVIINYRAELNQTYCDETSLPSLISPVAG